MAQVSRAAMTFCCIPPSRTPTKTLHRNCRCHLSLTPRRRIDARSNRFVCMSHKRVRAQLTSCTAIFPLPQCKQTSILKRILHRCTRKWVAHLSVSHRAPHKFLHNASHMRSLCRRRRRRRQCTLNLNNNSSKCGSSRYGSSITSTPRPILKHQPLRHHQPLRCQPFEKMRRTQGHIHMPIQFPFIQI